MSIDNNGERHVCVKGQSLNGRELARYEWAASFIKKGDRVLEIGTSTGYGYELLSKIGIDYVGVDYSEEVIELNKKQYPEAGLTETQWVCGDIRDLKIEEWGRFDVIIAFEVLEHVEEGRELAQRLKKSCGRLLISTPYNEPTIEEINSGVRGVNWGPHHRLHHLTEKDFPKFNYHYMNEEGKISDSIQGKSFNLLLMEWNSTLSEDLFGKIIASKEANPTVTVEISTKNRKDILHQCLIGVLGQTYKPTELIIWDDDDDFIDPRIKNQMMASIFDEFMARGIQWYYLKGERKGQHWNHQKTLEVAKGDWIWRIDDDDIAVSDCLEKMIGEITPEVVAVGPHIQQPSFYTPDSKVGSLKIEDIYVKPNGQWIKHYSGPVEHFNNTFIYRKDVAAKVGYNLNLSTVAHREETMLSWGLSKFGKLVYCKDAVVFHDRKSTGGIRSHQDPELYMKDEIVFSKWIKDNNIAIRDYKIFILAFGLGDNYVFIGSVLPELKKKYKDIIIISCFPQAYEGEDVLVYSSSEMGFFANGKDFDFYKHFSKNNTGKFRDLMREFYLGIYD